MTESVKVAVRVRPFQREKTRKATLVISMNGQTTEIKDPENLKAKPKSFTFDFSYWSHDGYKELKDGYLEPASNKYADQKKVFDDLGQGVLQNAWKGYNCSLFAYGQTGSGKSYSMVGYGANKGIVPITCEELFKGIENKRKSAGKGEEYQVTLSMLEIYSEQVRDLLNVKTMNTKGGLKIREHPQKGFYVEQLVNVPVNSYKEIDAKINQGTKNRTVASTNMNATSSRAHTIVAISFTQKSGSSGQNMTKTSVINLVDLAGSERAESTGATGDRLKEGSAINQSLSTLGNVIKALADQSQGKKGAMIPFRNSSLTKLLKNALGGNSKTVMIAALSPADINYEETLSTLRFADRAKAIKTKAVVNESPTDKLIRELREENAKLMDMMKKGGTGNGSGKYTEEEMAEMKRDLEESLRRNHEEMETMQKTWEEKMSEKEKEYQQTMAEERKKNEQIKVVPHLWNLNEDPSLSGMIVHFTPNGVSKIGNNKAGSAPDINLTGLGIHTEHASIVNDKKKVFLHPCAGARVVLNGNEISDKKELHHNDRVMFGTGNNLFVFHHPQDMANLQKKKQSVKPPTFEDAQEEIAKNSGLNNFTKGGKTKNDLLLQEDLIQIWPMIAEANAMSEELDKKVKFEVALVAPQTRGKKHGRTEVCVKMTNMANGNEFMWDRNKFIDRKYQMQEMYQNYCDGDKDWDLPKEKDPFWEDANHEVHIGNVYVYLQSLGHLIEMEESLQITDHRGLDQGVLSVAAYPCTQSGSEIGDDFVDDPSELLGKELHFKMKINNARGLPSKYNQTFCRYKLYLDKKDVETLEVPGTINPDYNHEKLFSFIPVTTQFLEYLRSEALLVEVWGRQKDDKSQGTLNTRELMQREKTIIRPGVKPEDEAQLNDMSDKQNKKAAEASTSKKRMERAEAKLRKLQTLVNQAKSNKESMLKVSDVDAILKSGSRLKAVAGIIAQIESAKKDSLGKVTSEACSLQ